MFHGGDSDSTGVIAACCYGALYGYEGVPKGNYKVLWKKEDFRHILKWLSWLLGRNEIEFYNTFFWITYSF